MVSRLPNLLVGSLLVGWWAYRLWGSRSAIVAMGLTASLPPLVAHSTVSLSLHAEQVGIDSLLAQKLVMSADFCNPTILDDNNSIRHAHG